MVGGIIINYSKLEKDILCFSKVNGAIGYKLPGFSMEEFEKIVPKEDHGMMITTRFIDYLVKEGYLSPVYERSDGNSKWEVSHIDAQSILPKGIDRLEELEFPIWYWMKKNWFSFIIAGVNILVGVGVVIQIL